MRSARQQSEIDSRSALTYSRNTGMNVLITDAQKLSALWMETAAAGVAGVLLLCPRPSLTRLWLSGSWLVSSSRRWPPRTTTGQHNFSGNYTVEGVSLGATNLYSRPLWVFTNSNSLKKKSGFPPTRFYCSVNQAFDSWHAAQKSFLRNSGLRLFSIHALEVLLNLFEIQWRKNETASVQISNHSQGDTRCLRSVPLPQIPVIISTYLHHWLCVWKWGSAGLFVPLLRTDQETRNKQD